MNYSFLIGKLSGLLDMCKCAYAREIAGNIPPPRAICRKSHYRFPNHDSLLDVSAAQNDVTGNQFYWYSPEPEMIVPVHLGRTTSYRFLVPPSEFSASGTLGS